MKVLLVRMLTLGVLIVAGGTVAALPFRIRKNTPEASLGSSSTAPNATEYHSEISAGNRSIPTQLNRRPLLGGVNSTAFDSPLFAPVSSSADSDRQTNRHDNTSPPISSQTVERFQFPHDSFQVQPLDNHSERVFSQLEQAASFERPPAPKPPHVAGDFSIRPLTYEDLAIQVSQSATMKDRYNAVAGNSSKMNDSPGKQPMDQVPRQQSILPDEWTSSFEPFSESNLATLSRDKSFPALNGTSSNLVNHAPENQQDVAETSSQDTQLISSPLPSSLQLPSLTNQDRQQGHQQEERQRHWIYQPR